MSTRFALLITVLATPFVALSRSAQAQSNPSPFSDPMAIPYTYGHQVCNAFATGDFDGDGFVDIASLTSSQFFVYRGHARDGFYSPSQNWLPGLANRVESGDMNGDGWTDLVFTLDVGSVLVLITNTHGGFDALPQVAVGTPARELVLGDLDADGDLDVVVGNYSFAQSTLTFCRNDGGGALTPYHTESLPARAQSLAIGRLDGDTSLDIAVGCFSTNSELRVIFNDGTGLFPTMTSLFVGQNMDEIEIADFDGDTKQDLSWRSYPQSLNKLQISYGDGAGHFATPVIFNFPLDNWYLWTTHGDLDNDGDQDLVVSDAFSVFYVVRNDGDAGFTKHDETSVSYSKEGRLLDVDADGNLDLIIGGDNIQVLFGDGHAGFTPTPTQILPRPTGTQLAHADLDADGNQDEIVGSYGSGNSYVTVCFGDGQGSISALQDVSLATDGTQANPAVTDWNGDTQPDVVVATRVGVSVLHNNGGVLTPFSTVDPGAGSRRIDGVDFDLDGFGDFLVANFDFRKHFVYCSDGVGGFTIRHTWTYVGNPYSTAIGDLNGDTFADFVIGTADAGYHNGTIYVWESQGSSYVLAASFSLSGGIRSLSSGDVDGDGDLDLSSLLNFNAGGFVYLNDGAGNLTQSAFLSMDPYARETHVADMDGDGDGDVVVFEPLSNRCATVFRSLGTGSFLPGASYFIGGETYGDVVDMNNDGRPDLVAVYSDLAANATALRVMIQSQPPVTVYCSSKVNSLACVPEITYSGVPSASAGSGFVIGANRILANKSGLFFYGHSGPNAVAFQGGTMCVKAPTVRLAIQTSGGSGGCTGSFATDFNVRIASGVDPALVIGERVCGQWWSRDTGFAPPNATSLTNALEFVIQQ